MTKVKKVKKFVKDNKTAIIVGIATGVGCLVGYKICMHKIIKQDPRILCDNLKELLDDAEVVYGENKNKALYAQVIETAIKPEELGELGKQMIENAKKYPGKEFKFTHFFAIGEFKEK